MNRVVSVAVVVLMATLLLSAYAYTFYLPGLANNSSSSNGSQNGSGSQGTNGYAGPGASTLNIYLTDKPPSSTSLKYLLVNVSSVTLRYAGSSGNSTTTTSTSSTKSASTDQTTSPVSSADSPPSQFTFDIPGSTGTNLNITSLHGQGVLLGTTKIPPGNVTMIVFRISGAVAFYTDGSSRQLKVVADGKLMIPVHFTVQPNGSTDLTIDITPNSVHTSQGQADVLTPVIHVTVVTRATTTTTTVTTVTSLTTSMTTTNSTAVTSTTTVTNSSSTSTTTSVSSTESTSSTNSTSTT